MQTNNMVDVTPKFIVLATTKTGNHPFSHIATKTGAYDEYATLDIDALKEVIKDYKNDFEGKIFIGKRAGFMDDKNDELVKLVAEFSELIELKTINEAMMAIANKLKIKWIDYESVRSKINIVDGDFPISKPDIRFQPTLDVPPISTVLGLINSAAGQYIKYSDILIGYYFEYGAKAIDLETIYQIELKTTNQGISV
jgi:hypothetical protein